MEPFIHQGSAWLRRLTMQVHVVKSKTRQSASKAPAAPVTRSIRINVQSLRMVLLVRRKLFAHGPQHIRARGEMLLAKKMRTVPLTSTQDLAIAFQTVRKWMCDLCSGRE